MSKKDRSERKITRFERMKMRRKGPPLFAVRRAISQDPDAQDLLEMILKRAMHYTIADAGTIYLVEKVPLDSMGGALPKFKFVLKFACSATSSKGSKNGSKNSSIINIDTSSIAGAVALTGDSVIIEDCYQIPEGFPGIFNYDFDEKNSYRTKSMLAVPIRSSKGSVIGVIQLINKIKVFRRREDPPLSLNEKDIVSFTNNDLELIETFSLHAASALENAKLTNDIAKLFESFVKASVTAIEARDPSTSGHSDRVAALTVAFAKTIGNISTGPFHIVDFTDDQIRELRYAALLHDFGKIGVSERVLLKSKKLYPNELESILMRLETLCSVNEAREWRKIAESLANQEIDLKLNDPSQYLQKTLWKIDQFNLKVSELKRGILEANESQVFDKDFDIHKLMLDIKKMSSNFSKTILSQEEEERLSIPQGTLSPFERKEIESHVSHTYDFLRKIAWTEDLSGVPDIAHAHHEKLDGSGYPRQLVADQIPIQARMMTISDIFDALTSMDRPYKESVSTEKALDILNFEAKQGKIDSMLLEIFIESKIYKFVNEVDKKLRDAG